MNLWINLENFFEWVLLIDFALNCDRNQSKSHTFDQRLWLTRCGVFGLPSTLARANFRNSAWGLHKTLYGEPSKTDYFQNGEKFRKRKKVSETVLNHPVRQLISDWTRLSFAVWAHTRNVRTERTERQHRTAVGEDCQCVPVCASALASGTHSSSAQACRSAACADSSANRLLNWICLLNSHFVGRLLKLLIEQLARINDLIGSHHRQLS